VDDDVRIMWIRFSNAIYAHELKHKPDGIVYEDACVIMEYKDGQYLMTGKPFAVPFIYQEVK